jgi:hypothetical protein
MQGDNFDAARLEIGRDQGLPIPIPLAGWKGLAAGFSLFGRPVNATLLLNYN